MIGLLKNVLGTVLLALFLLTAALWVRSYWVCELCQHTKTSRENLAFYKEIFGVASGRGGLYIITAKTTWAEPTKRKADEQAARIKDGWERTIPPIAGYGGALYYNVGVAIAKATANPTVSASIGGNVDFDASSLDLNAIVRQADQLAGGSFSATFPASSITLIVLPKLSVPLTPRVDLSLVRR